MARTTATTVRLPEPVLDALRDQAQRNFRSLSGELQVMLEQHLEAPAAPKQPGHPSFDYAYGVQGGRA